MRVIRLMFIAFIVILSAAFSAQSAFASFGISEFQASTCSVSTCTRATPLSDLYTQAGGHPAFGITDIHFNSSGGIPEDKVKDIRVDVPTGLNTNPFAVPQCTAAELALSACLPETKVGEDVITTEVLGSPVSLSLPVYNMVPPQGSPLEAAVMTPGAPTYIVGGLDSRDYHEYFTISNISNTLPILDTRLIFYGAPEEQNGGGAPNNAFLTNPSVCNGPQTTRVSVDSYENPGVYVSGSDTTPVEATGCDLEPFNPTLIITPSTTRADTPVSGTVKLEIPQNLEPSKISSSDLQTAQLELPSGVTINPSVANGVTAACTPAEFAQGTTTPITCPEGSVLGAVTITTPDLNEPLVGKLYLASPNESGVITSPPYTLYLAASSERFGVYIRLVGSATPNPETGRLNVVFPNNPQQPLSVLQITLNGGETAALANPLSCGELITDSVLTPFSGGAAATPSTSFTTDLDGLGGACPGSFPFAPVLSANVGASGAGAQTNLTESATRADEEQYVSTITTQLPPGFLGLTPNVALCSEAAANSGECGDSSLIGSASVSSGAGSEPLALSGKAYLTGAYKGSPFGLAIVVPIDVGPFQLGDVVVRAQIQVNPLTGQITVVSDPLPQIFQGIPIRLRAFTVDINRPGFLVNPTSCTPLATTMSIGSTTGATATLSSPFQAQGCSSLPFSPKLTVNAASAKNSRLDGASLNVTVTQSNGQSNIHSVATILPRQLVSRVTTLQKACLAATFNTNPASCPAGSVVGSATVSTPVLSSPLTGPAYLVSHGGAAFPDLTLLLQGEGVTVELVGNTNISEKGITSTTFAALPDAPFSSFHLTLPTGSDSLLGVNGSLCTQPKTISERVLLRRKGKAVRKHGKLVYSTKKVTTQTPISLVMPTTITGQNGALIQQQTPINVSGCPKPVVKILKVSVSGRSVNVTVRVPAKGVATASGSYIRSLKRIAPRAETITLKTKLNAAGARLLNRKRKVSTSIKVLFTAEDTRSQATRKVTFKRK